MMLGQNVQRETGMNARLSCLVLALAGAASGAWAGDGLAVPAAETLWPQWQARITVQAASVSPLTLSRMFDAQRGAPGAMQGGVQGGAVLGDYYFAKPSFGNFRASGGLLIGSMGGVPLLSGNAGSRLDLGISSGGGVPLYAAADSPGTVPYLGLGFTGGALRSALSITADVGLVAERPGAAGGVGRAIFGSQALDGAVREMRLSPVLQLGVRYTF
jgi:hypothetical protein